MPGMVDPYGARPYVAPPDSTPADGRANSLRLRMRTAVHRAGLTNALAAGVDPDANAELALRARQLTSRCTRRAFARSLHRTVAEAHRPATMRSRVVSIIDRAAVLNAEDAITELTERLRSPASVRPEGMAMLDRILTNAEWSPLYNSAEPGAFRRVICEASAALDARPCQSHEFVLAV